VQRDVFSKEDNPLESPYLIQRMKLRKVAAGEGRSIDDLFSMDYMGSSEFEWGALPESLKRICRNIDAYELFTPLVNGQQIHDFRGFPLVLIAPRELHEEYGDFLVSLVGGAAGHLKEPSYITNNVSGKEWNGKALSYGKVDAWWDIENDVFFAFGVVADTVVNAVRGTIEKKRAEGKTDWLPKGKA